MKKYIFFISIFSFLIFLFPKSISAACCVLPNKVGCAQMDDNNKAEEQACGNSKGEYIANADCIKGQCKQKEGFGTAPVAAPVAAPVTQTSNDKFYFQVPFPGSQEIENSSADVRMLEYLVLIFRLGVWFAVFLAIFMIMVAGFLYLTAGGSSERVGRAKEYVGGALSGLVIALFSFVILQTINPRLVELSFPKIPGPDLFKGTGKTCCWHPSTKDRKFVDLIGKDCSSLDPLLGSGYVECPFSVGACIYPRIYKRFIPECEDYLTEKECMQKCERFESYKNKCFYFDKSECSLYQNKLQELDTEWNRT